MHLELKMMEMQNGKEWWCDKWWLSEEYARLYKDRLNSDEVDRTIDRVIKVFDANWQRETPKHPVLYWLLSQGTEPLRFVYGLGKDLITLEGSARLRAVTADLQDVSKYESALLELEVAAHLKRSGHLIEFRPYLPNGRQSDFLASFGDQQVYFEIKRLRESDVQGALNYLGQAVYFALLDLTRESSESVLAGQRFDVELDTGLADLLGTNPDQDQAIIEGIKHKIVAEITEKAKENRTLDFIVPSIARVTTGDVVREGSRLTVPAVSSQTELRRFLRGHFLGAIEQIHSEHAGMIVVQTSGYLEHGVAGVALDGLFSQLGPRASHVCAVVFLPVFNWMPTTWANFKPFAVLNKSTRFPATNLQAFADLQPLLQVEVAVPGSE